MKQHLITGVIAVIGGLIVAYFAYTLNREVFNVRYTLSEQIPTKFGETQAIENVQKLVVKNNGSSSVSKIQIKIKRNVEKAEILKSSPIDTVKEYIANGYFEAIYPELPAGGSFTYSFKSVAEGISKSDLDIRHSRGEVRDALAASSKSIASMVVDIFFYLAILFYLSTSIITVMVTSMESKVRYEKYDAFLKRKKPFYITQNKWQKLRKEAIENFSTSGYSNPKEIENTLAYKVLNQERPEYLNEEEWQLLLEKAIRQFEKDFAEATHLRSSEKLITYFAVQKPIAFPAGKWLSFLNDLSNEYITRKKYDITRWTTSYSDLRTIEKEITSAMPKGMNPDYWTDYINFLKNQYYALILREIYSHSDKSPLRFIESYNLDYFENNEKNIILDTAYKIEVKNLATNITDSNASEFMNSQKPAWLHDNDYRTALNQANKLIEADELKKKYQQLYEEVRKRNSEIESEEKNIKELKQKIERQLKVIHEFMGDPTVIDRIEEYDNVFAPGNFENLKKLAQSLKEHKVLQ